MVKKPELESSLQLISRLHLPLFQQRFPWIGGDLQTLRDTFRTEELPLDQGENIQIPIPPSPSGICGSGYLLGLLDRPNNCREIRGLVLMLHGLGGSSQRTGLRRMATSLQAAGFAVLRVNLRGADPGRHLAGGTYSAQCNSDIYCVFEVARELCLQLSCEKAGIASTSNRQVPLLGVGISLGGTILLNACLEGSIQSSAKDRTLDGLVCTSSPLDLSSCSASIERTRNIVYQRWLLKRLIRQTLADPFGIEVNAHETLVNGALGKGPLSTIREFDEAITAPRWGYKDVDDYYKKASPLNKIFLNHSSMPRTLILHALDDPWVPAKGAQDLLTKLSLVQKTKVEVIMTSSGGHNGFHGGGGCWGDQVVENWFTHLGF